MAMDEHMELLGLWVCGGGVVGLRLIYKFIRTYMYLCLYIQTYTEIWIYNPL